MEFEVPVTSSLEVGQPPTFKLVWSEAFTPYSGSVPAYSEAQAVTATAGHRISECYYYCIGST